MRICFVVSEYPTLSSFGGIATYTERTARWLVNNGHEVHVICANQGGVYPDETLGIQVFYACPQSIPLEKLLSIASHLPGLRALKEVQQGWGLVEQSLGAWLTVLRNDRRQAYDVIECEDYSPLAFWGFILGFKKRIILRGHGVLRKNDKHVPDWPGRDFHFYLERFCAVQANCILTVSKYLSNIYQSEFAIDGEKIETVPLGFNIGYIDTSIHKSPIVSRWKGFPAILYVGRIEKEKGFQILTDALRIAHAECSQLRAILIGSVSENSRDEFDDFMSLSSDWCWHTGHLAYSDVLALMHQSDLLILPSLDETIGTVIVEAALCGIPQIGTAVGGIPEVIIDGETGFLVEPGNIDSIVSIMLMTCENPDQLRQMGNKARQNAIATFDIDIVIRNQLHHYQTICS
jgi:glycosyltransferase involved in cell wall biosynthesis